MKISFLGDISLNNTYSQFAYNNKNPFKGVEILLKQSDYVIGNLEAVAEVTNGENENKQTSLKVNYKSLNLLKSIKVNLLTLANNHIYDQLLDGFKKTISFLNDIDIDHTGASVKSKGLSSTFVKVIGSKKIAFLNYVHNDTNPGFPDNCEINVNIYNREHIKSDIIQIKQSVDFIVLILHWGLDNSRFPEPWQRKDAQLFIDTGVHLIIGHHSHVLQGYEKIENAWVFYSLGNFAFAPVQEDRENDLDLNRQRDSIVLHWTVEDNIIDVDWDPICLDRLNVIPSNNSKIKRLTRLIPFVSNRLIFPFYHFYLNIIYKVYFYFFGNGRNPFQQLKNINKNKLRRAKQIITFK